jgi:4-hydroxy-4-methyl-2-oxoglutarate aldolase
MIGDPVALTVRRSIERPAPAVMRAFEGAPTGFVTDAYNGRGCMDHVIKPLTPDMYVCGTAITALCHGGDLLAVMAALDFAQKGDVIVIAGAGETSAAKLGDLWLHWAKRIGVAGIVCDGLVRDVKGLLSVGLPVFARGACPNGAFKTGPGEINTAVSCGNVPVQPGDIIVGDRDGVVAVPRNLSEAVAAQLALVRQKEADAEEKIRRGEKLKFWDEAALAARGAIRYLD